MPPEVVPTKPFIRASWVRHQLLVRGTSFRAIARKRGCSPQAVSRAMYFPNLPIEKLIAEAIGRPVSELFPERYDANGQRFHSTREHSSSRARKAKSRGRANDLQNADVQP
jgi:lambda repressor-like predicted transcriptional regulator